MLDVQSLLAAADEADRGVDPKQWAALEHFLGYVENDQMNVPSAERDAVIRDFIRLGWTVPAPEPEPEPPNP